MAGRFWIVGLGIGLLGIGPAVCQAQFATSGNSSVTGTGTLSSTAVSAPVGTQQAQVTTTPAGVLIPPPSIAGQAIGTTPIAPSGSTSGLAGTGTPGSPNTGVPGVTTMPGVQQAGTTSGNALMSVPTTLGQPGINGAPVVGAGGYPGGVTFGNTLGGVGTSAGTGGLGTQTGVGGSSGYAGPGFGVGGAPSSSASVNGPANGQ